MHGEAGIGVRIVPARRQDNVGVFELRGHEAATGACNGGALAYPFDLGAGQALGEGVEAIGVDAKAIALETGVGGIVSFVDVEWNSRAAEPLGEAQATQTRADDVDM
ncbi:hypothetical protein EGJ56_15605 [Pandoraea apista]|nr:hypothetical protein EGJ56_15605 [Pandoraea apista]